MNYQTNKKKIAHAFNRAVKSYDYNSKLQILSGNILLSKTNMPIQALILDAGCGTGWFSKKFINHGHTVIALDISEKMLKKAQKYNMATDYIQGDIENIPLLNNIVDICWSNLSLQWCCSLSTAISELFRVTKSGGIIMFSILVDGSLLEMIDAWKKVDDNHHVNNFITIKEVLLSCQSYNLILLDTEWITLNFSNVLEAMLSLKKIGATYLNNGKINKVVTRNQINQLNKYWTSNSLGYLLSYKLCFGVIQV